MGECGCSSFHPTLKLPAPDGKVYLFAVYPGCYHCDAPAGVDLWLIGPRVAKRDYGIDVAEVPLLEFHDDKPAIAAIPVLHPLILRRKLAAFLTGMEVDDGKIDDIAADVILEDGFGEHFAAAVRETEANPLDEPDKRPDAPALQPAPVQAPATPAED